MISTTIAIHLRDTKPEVAVRENYAVIHLGNDASGHSLFFESEQGLRTFAESILQQLNTKELAV